MVATADQLTRSAAERQVKLYHYPIPSVTSAAASQWPLFNNTTLTFPICVHDHEPSDQRVDWAFVFPGFFHTWGVTILAGRDFSEAPEPGLVVNETFASTYLPGGSPLGRSIGVGECPGRSQLPVIGVVADHRDRQRAARVPTAYVRYPRAGALYTTTYAVRTASDPVQVIPMVRRIVAEAGASVEGDVTTGTSYRDRTMTRERLLASLLGSFASVALVLCALGIYGLLSYTTSWRTAEIGVRVALGASRRQVVLLVLWDSLVPMVVGVAIGGAAAAALTRGLAALLFEVSPTDRWTWSMAAALLVLVSVAAAAAPSLRAARTDPAQALKWD